MPGTTSARRVAALLVTFLAACGTPPSPPGGVRDAGGGAPGPRGALEAAVRVFATGETRGHLQPCKCQERQFGGLPRRAAYLASTVRTGDLVVDLGNAAEGDASTRALRLATTLDALRGMHYAAFVPGELEALVADTLVAEAAARPELPVVTANLVRDDGSAAFPAWTLHDLADGRRLGVVGLTQPVRPLPPGWRFVAARDALERALAELAGRCDAVVVASSLDPDETRAVCDGLPAVALGLAASDAPASLPAPGDRDVVAFDGARAPVVEIGGFAVYVRCVDLDASLRAVRTWRAWLGEDVPGLPSAVALVERHRAAAAAADPTLVPDLLRARAADGFAGSAACAECHAAEHATWAESRHARAMQSLARERAARAPECVPCHLVDVPAAGVAADDAAGDALGVGCEACHGPRARHIASAVQGIVPPGGAPTWSARDVCTGCHHPPEVVRFDPDEAWRAIAHGRAHGRAR